MLLDRDPQGHVRDNAKRTDMGNSFVNEDISSLDPKFSINPVTRSVVNPLPESIANAKTVVKVNHQKANHTIGKNRTEVLISKPAKKGKVRFQEQPSGVTPSVLESKSFKKETGHYRAFILRREYPGILGVSDSITKKQRQKILFQHKARFPGVSALASTQGKKSKLGQASPGPSLPAVQQKTWNGPPLPDLSGDRCDKVAKATGGASNENPITID